MSQSFAKIIGPINQNEIFYMGGFINTENFIVTYDISSPDDIFYVFDFDDVTPIAILSAEYYIDEKGASNPNYIKLLDTINKVNINRVYTIGLEFIPNSQVNPIYSYTDNIENWSYPTLFLANIPYTLQNCKSQTITNCNPDPKTPGLYNTKNNLL